MSEQAGAARGLAFITLAKLYFILTGFVLQLGLPRLLGSPNAFGQYSLALSFVSVVNNVLIAATVQSVSKRISEVEARDQNGEALAGARLRQALGLQLGIGLVLSGSMFLGAPALAKLGYDAELTPLLRTASFVPLCYALYAALVGSLNGRRLFKQQAFLDMIFSTVRTLGILGAAALGFGAFGALSGFAVAALVILLIALLTVGTGSSGPKLPIREWFGFLVPIVLFQAMLNGTLLLDVWVLQNTASGLGIEAGISAVEAANQAKTFVGLYKAGQNFALVPYQIILSVTFVVFPLVSRAIAEGDHEAAKGHIRNALRFSLIVLFSFAAPIGGAAEALVRLAYGVNYLEAAQPLSILVFGQVALALFVIIATILSSAGRPVVSVWVGAIGLTVVLLANRLFVRFVGLGPDTLRAAAIATSLGTACALVAGAAALKGLMGASLPYATLVRCALAGAMTMLMAQRLPQGSALLAPVVMLVAALFYFVLLVLLGELKREDATSVLALLRKKKQPAIA